MGTSVASDIPKSVELNPYCFRSIHRTVVSRYHPNGLWRPYLIYCGKDEIGYLGRSTEIKGGISERLQAPKFIKSHPGQGLSMAVNLLGAVADILIAAALFYFLHTSRTGFKK